MAPAPRDIYRNDVDFKALAEQDRDFAKKLKSNGQLDFSDPESVLFNYILWVQDILDSTSPGYRESYGPTREVVGIDIGIGASAIFPLLACRQRPNWKFIGTEIDDKSFEYARRNIERNGLADRIEVLKVDENDGRGKDGPLVPESVLEKFERIDILLTNPPFHSSSTSLITSRTLKSLTPNSICTGSPTELITPGGETAFVFRLIAQSSHPTWQRKVSWWSSMLGKLSSVGVVVERLKGVGCRNWAVTEFVQGARTRRWGVAWSWGGRRPRMGVARGIKARVLRGSVAQQSKAGLLQDRDRGRERNAEQEGLEGGLLPFPSEFSFTIHHHAPVRLVDVAGKLNEELNKLDLRWQWKSGLNIGLGIATEGDCWSRRARRSKERQNQSKVKGEDEDMRDEDEDEDEDEDDEDEDNEDKEPEFVFKISIKQSPAPEGINADGQVLIMVRWLQGQDHVLFESFCGWLKRKMGS